MPRRPTTRRPPPLRADWRRLAARMPISFFRAGLGRLFGGRLLLLHHTGRLSGLDRLAVLEVVEHDPTGGSWTVASGLGPRTDWYRNLRKQPKTVVQVGGCHHAVTAHFLTPDDGAEVMVQYARRHPRTVRLLCAFMHVPVDGSESAFREAVRGIPFVQLEASVPPRTP
ncbi:nitroreductase family deazaflavin-dependent oxidoreductase [Streptomyces tropicalis]|uniref:Nitroreductase family deazaflavin-dependent oxidoreductase n=1 Tax=Streptomyces tropicalis TaxID=3034234 RepID=A0ABT6AAR6_9ACTN|nr:nitroreductase family deazaflavin-dependent oxidoreductase [Streptomyces tropicalis]MDF3301729.1 nitroreductase family deazaflavin-dependent oxidoreductase [Streptomyces tropicalis]